MTHMALWKCVVNGEVVGRWNSDDSDQKDDLARFMDITRDNVLPGLIPSFDVFDANDWKHLVRASLLLASDYYGPASLDGDGFTLDDVYPYYSTSSGDKVVN